MRLRTLLAAVVATLALVAVGCGSSDDPATAVRPATAATPATPAARAATGAAPATAASPGASASATTTAAPAGSGVLGSNGKMYRCLGSSLLSDLRAMSRRIDRGRKSLKRIRGELRRLKRRYPAKVAPPRVAQRYNYLVRKHNALLRLGNRRVSAYNNRLERDCVKG